MKYRKSNDLTYNQKLMIITKEMVNIETGITYFDDDGNRLITPKPGHNTYVIDDVSYEVHPNIGVVYVFDADDTFTLECIQDECKSLFEDDTLVGRASGSIGTTQYMAVTDCDKPSTTAGYMKNSNTSSYSLIGNEPFVWFIYTDVSRINDTPLYVPFFNSSTVKQENQLLSLSTIIIDNLDILTLEDKHISPDLPTIHNYREFANGYICDRPIRLCERLGIRAEIASNFLEETKIYNPDPIYHNIFWIDWNDVSASHLIECGLDWDEQVKKQALQKYDYDMLDTRAIANQKNYRCIITGIPIYEDCYVLDIYEQKVVQSVNVNDLDMVLANGGELYKSPNGTNVNGKIVIKTNITKKLMKIDRTELKVRTMPKKKGQAEPAQFVDVVVTINHEKPLHVLMSPYGMHCYMKIIGSLHFEIMTKSNVIVYRSFCPRLAVDVIDNIDASDLYKQMLYAANIYIKKKPAAHRDNNICSFNSLNGYPIHIYKNISMHNIIDSAHNKYIASLYFM
jgi:hypothetical protein